MEHDHPVIGPADDTATFFQPRGMVFVTVLWVTAAAWTVCYGMLLGIRALFGMRPEADDIATIVETLIVVPFVVSGIVLLVTWRRLGWLHSSVHGLEFAATGRRGVSIPWSAVAAVALRHRGVFTELIVTPAGPEVVHELPGPGRRPRRHGESYLVDIGLMSPGPETLLAELHRRMPSKV